MSPDDEYKLVVLALTAIGVFPRNQGVTMSPDDEYKLVVLALTAIGDIIEAVRGAKSGTLKPEDALDQIDKLRASLAKNDADAETTLDQRFPK